jgi:hypothetical protein
MMKVQYLFSSSQGDNPVSEEELDGPLHTSLSETHPALTLRHYFQSVEEFLLKDDASLLIQAIFRGFGRRMTPDMISRMLIRCEKVGTLYHVARITFESEGTPMQMAVATAITDEATRCMQKEVLNLRLLSDTYQLTSLPRVFFKGETVCHTPQGDFTLSHVIQEWFEDYHEWHLTRDRDGKGQRLLIWDQKRGYHPASAREYHEIFRQAAKILTLCYDVHTFRQIYPWHHAAGDFIVKSTDQNVDVKLTTVRGYGPLLVFREKDKWDPWKAFIIFFLNLTIKMRLDREDGVGDVMWADDTCVSATLEGFVDGLQIMEAEGRLHFGKTSDIIALLKTFTVEELRSLMDILLGFYRQNERGSYPVVRSNLESHVKRLQKVIQAIPP